MTDPAAPCPECGARVAWPGAAPAWMSTFSSALTILVWSIPAMLLAWASPNLMQVARESSTIPLVGDASWLLLLTGAPIAFAVRQLIRCLPYSSASVWCGRLVTLALAALALDAAGASNFMVAMVMRALPNSYNFAVAVWPTLFMVLLAAATIPAGAVLAAAARECGLFRAATRLWRATVVVSMGATVSHMWFREGGRFLPPSVFGAPDPDRALRDVVGISIDAAGLLSPLLVVTLALVAWRAAALAKAQLAARPGT